MTYTDEAYEYQTFAPGSKLSPYIQFFYYFHSSAQKPERILPLSYAEITINVSNRGPKVYLLPPGAQSYFVVPHDLHRIIGICFKPWGLHRLLGLPVRILGPTKSSLDNWLPALQMAIEEIVEEQDELSLAIPALRSLLEKTINASHSLLLEDVIRYIHSHNGQATLPELYRRYGYSTRTLQQIFESAVGMSPKKYSRLKRFHYAVKRLPSAGNLTSLALDLGYYDQSHFIHEFKAFAGISPKNFLKESNQLNAINALSWFSD